MNRFLQEGLGHSWVYMISRALQGLLQGVLSRLQGL